MGKLTSLRHNVTNVYAKCRKWNEKKIYESVQLCSVLLSLESTVNYLKSKNTNEQISPLQNSWFVAKGVFRNGQQLHFIRSLFSNTQHYFFVVLNSSFCSRTYLFFSLELQGLLKVTKPFYFQHTQCFRKSSYSKPPFRSLEINTYFT